MSARQRMSLRRVSAMLRPYAVGERLALTTGVVMGLGAVALHILRPWPLKWIIDHFGGHGHGSGVGAWIAADPTRGVALLSLLFVVITTLGAATEYGQTLLLNGAGNRVLFRFRAALFGHLMDQPLRFHEAREIGELVTRVIYDTSRLRRGLNAVLLRSAQTIVLFVATFAVLLVLAPGMGLVLAVGGVAAILSMRRRGRLIASAARKQRAKEGGLAAMVGSDLLAIRELQASGPDAGATQARFARRNQRSLGQEQKVRRLAAGLVLRVDVVLAISITIALWMGARAILAGRLTPGDLALFFAYAMALRGPFTDLALATGRLGRVLACAERLERIIRRPSSILEAPGGLPIPPGPADLRFVDVALKSPKGRRTDRKWALDGMNCAFPAGARIAVIGANGAGKSTLLALVLRLRDPDRGHVELDGHDLRDYSLTALRTSISVVFQDSVLTGLSVRENIALGLPDADLDAITLAATRARAAEFIDRLPDGYDTIVTRSGGSFSGGQRQRIALARALLRNGRVWLLDEPTSGLDHATAEELSELLLEATRGRTTLWVSHDPEFAARLDWVLALEGGTVAFNGPPDEHRRWLAQHADPGPKST